MKALRKCGSILLVFLMLPLLMGCGQSLDSAVATKLIAYQDEKYDSYEASGEMVNGVRVIEIHATQFTFEPKLIVVNKGENIKLIVYADDVPHGFEIEGFMIEDYDINTVIRKGMPLELEFTADTLGIWEFICTIYCGFGHSQMKGIFVVR